MNDNTEIRDANGKGLGLFASQRLTKGLRIFSEEPFLVYESRDEAVRRISTDFQNLSEDDKGIFTRLHAGSLDLVPFLQAGSEIRNTAAVSAQRLARIAAYNSFEGVGVGCVIAKATAALNHEQVLH